MSDPVTALMTSDEFIAWAMEQPKGQRYELFAGKVVGMAQERSAHALAKFRVLTRIVREGDLVLDPPGLKVTELFEG